MNPIFSTSTCGTAIHVPHHSVTTATRQHIQTLDLSRRKIIQVVPTHSLPICVQSRMPKVPLEADWNPPSPILVTSVPRTSIVCKVHAGSYYAGGIPALMQAVRALYADPMQKVTYVNDGQILKSTQSGHQGHVHPSEWTTQDCSTKNLIQTLLEGIGVKTPEPPQNTRTYSYLHFPVSLDTVTKHPLQFTSLYFRFFKHRILHNLISQNGVSSDDQWLCEAVRSSLSFHRALSEDILKTQGEPTFLQGFRVYWSPNKEAIDKKQKLWTALGIKTEFMKKEEFKKYTLFKEGAELYVLKIYGDGKFLSGADNTIVEHMTKTYPTTFASKQAVVSEVLIDTVTKKPFAVREKTATSEERVVAVDSFFGSVGHDQVFTVDPISKTKKQLFEEIPVSGVSTLWLCTVEKNELYNRLANASLDDETLVLAAKELVASANLSNLHVTVWDAAIEDDKVHITCRATQGAAFNSLVADSNDLINMTENLQQFFIGDWTLISAGTCTRKTCISNVPEFTHSFLHGLSGIGFSFSAVAPEMLQRKPIADTSLSELVSAFAEKLKIV